MVAIRALDGAAGAPKRDFPQWFQADLRCPVPRQKIFRCSSVANQRLSAAHPVPQEGALATSLTLGQAAVGAGPVVARESVADVRRGRRRQNRVVLTPRELASSWRVKARRRWWQESRSPGRARHKPSNHCAGKAGVFPPNLFARVRYCLIHRHTRPRVRRAPGPSLRPLFAEDANEIANLGQMPVARMRKCVWRILRDARTGQRKCAAGKARSSG